MKYTPQLKQEYEELFNQCIPNHKDLNYVVNKILSNRPLYEKIGIVPWWVVGAIHNLEASFNMNCHIHNGDPLSAKTVHVPKGRPVNGNPPYKWEESAFDAFSLQGKWDQWDIAGSLWYCEKYNGFGYRKSTINIPSPYLWSGSNIYSKGKYASDGRYDPNLVSKQVGAGVVFKKLVMDGLLDFNNKTIT